MAAQPCEKTCWWRKLKAPPNAATRDGQNRQLHAKTSVQKCVQDSLHHHTR